MEDNVISFVYSKTVMGQKYLVFKNSFGGIVEIPVGTDVFSLFSFYFDRLSPNKTSDEDIS